MAIQITSTELRWVTDRHMSVSGIAALIAIFGALLLVTPNFIFGQDEKENLRQHSLSVTDITTEWSNREHHFNTVHMSWHVARDSAKSPNNYQTEFSTPADRQHQPVLESLWLSGHKICYEARRWYAELDREFAGYSKESLFPKFVDSMRRGHDDVRKWDRSPYHFKLVWEPANHRELLDGVSGWPSLATIRDSSTSLVLNSKCRISPGLIFWPVLMAFRPMIPLVVKSPDQGFVLQDETSTIGNDSCVVIVVQSDEGVSSRLWVVPEKGFSVVRAMNYLGGHLRQQFDIEYAHDQDAGWFPNAWTIMVFNPDGDYPGQAEVFQSVQVEVDRHEVNQPEDSRRFALEIPVGAVVNDQVSNRVYVVAENGVSRRPTPVELKSLTGNCEPAFVDSRSQQVRYNITVGTGLAVSVVTMWLLRRRKLGKPIKESLSPSEISADDHV